MNNFKRFFILTLYLYLLEAAIELWRLFFMKKNLLILTLLPLMASAVNMHSLNDVRWFNSALSLSNNSDIHMASSLALADRYTLLVETGMHDDKKGYSRLNYQWQQGNDSCIHLLGCEASYSPQNTIIVDTAYISRDAYVQESTNTVGGNLNQMLVMDARKVISVNRNNSRSMGSALIIELECGNEGASILAHGSIAEAHLKLERKKRATSDAV